MAEINQAEVKEVKKTPAKSGSTQAEKKPEKLLKSGVPASVGKATQWKKGQSGNPEGPKPGFKHLSTHIQELLNDEKFKAWVSDPRYGAVEFTGRPMEAIIKAMTIRAINGDHKAADWIAKYGYGSKVDVDVTSQGESINPYARLTTEELRRLAGL